MHSSAVMDPATVRKMIEGGRTLVIFKDNVLCLDAWQHSHPGGHLVIQHMVGRDATDEMSIYHSTRTLETMCRFRIGTIQGPWANVIPPIQREGYSMPAKMVAEKPMALTEKTPTDSLPSKEDQCAAAYAPAPSILEPAVLAALSHDLSIYPPLDPVTQQAIGDKFKVLHAHVENGDYYRLDKTAYMAELTRYSLLFGAFLTCIHHDKIVLAACFLGLFWHQIMFTAHDAGHLGISHNFVIDNLIGIFIGNLCCGLSIGWWKSSHNVHHLVTNDPVHDPDIQNVPLFATSAKFFESINSTYYDGFCFVWDRFAEIAIQYQRYTYYPVMAIARFNLYLLSWGFLLSPHRNASGRAKWIRPVEIFAISCYFYLYGYVLLYRNIPSWQDRIIFVLISHIITMPLHVQITLSHWGTSTSDLGPTESFAQRQLRTTADVTCPAWLDWIHGGLQFQAIHHLFPRVPRHNLRKLRPLVLKFCKETKIPYLCSGFIEGNKGVLDKLQDIADQAALMTACGKEVSCGMIPAH